MKTKFKFLSSYLPTCGLTLSALSLVVIHFSCSNRSYEEHNFKTIQVSGDSISNLPFDISLQKIVPLETTSASAFGQYYNMELIDSSIYVFDQKTTKTVYKFDGDGNFIGKISKGRAPFELVGAYASSFDEIRHLIYVYDYDDQKMKVYDFDLHYLYSILMEDPSIGYTNFVKLASGKWFSHTIYNIFRVRIHQPIFY